MKKHIAVFLALVMVISLGITANASGTDFSDIKGNFAESAIKTWSGLGIIQGYNGKFMPDDPITRADFAVILDRLMNYQVKATNTFKDLGNSYYTDAVLKAAHYGVMKGDQNQNALPMSSITRQDAFLMLFRAFALPTASGYTITAKDASDISPYAKDAVATLMALGMIQGRDDGSLAPKASITRAELVYTMNSIVSQYYNAAGTYTKDATGIVLVNTPDVTLKDMTINGSLIIAPGVGSGTVTLMNVNVKGSIFVLGGGTNSIRIEGSTSISGGIYIRMVDGKVRVYANGVEIPYVTIEDGSNDVILDGTFGSVTVDAGINITLPAGAVIKTLYLNAAATFSGPGKINSAILTSGATGAKFETQPDTIKAPTGVTLSIGSTTIISDGSDINSNPNPGPGPGPGPSANNHGPITDVGPYNLKAYTTLDGVGVSRVAFDKTSYTLDAYIKTNVSITGPGALLTQISAKDVSGLGIGGGNSFDKSYTISQPQMDAINSSLSSIATNFRLTSITINGVLFNIYRQTFDDGVVHIYLTPNNFAAAQALWSALDSKITYSGTSDPSGLTLTSGDGVFASGVTANFTTSDHFVLGGKLIKPKTTTPATTIGVNIVGNNIDLLNTIEDYLAPASINSLAKLSSAVSAFNLIVTNNTALTITLTY